MFAFLGSAVGQVQFYVIPAGVSLLVLVRVFKDDLSANASAKLRAMGITVIYGAAAWRPLLFAETWEVLLCVTICVVGVAVGVALRIRSYVYFGTAFMVCTVLSNFAHHGLRDHRLGALFLLGLGLFVVGGMVFFTAKRAQILGKYAAVREMLEGWEG